MIIGIFGDLHFNDKRPERRLDDWWTTMCSKFCEGLEIFHLEKCDLIVAPGDLVEHPGVSNLVIAEIIKMLKSYDMVLHMVFGQHDISGHSEATLPTSPLSVLKAAGVINMFTEYNLAKGIMMYSAGFGQQIPKLINDDYIHDKYNILVIHAMISDIALYPGHEFTQAQSFLRQHPEFQLVICGDVHRRFICTYEGRTIINAGPLMRDTIDKHILEHEPAVVIFDTDTGKYKVIKLKVEPIEKVIDLTPAKKRNNDLLNKFIERVKAGGKVKSGWKNTLITVIKEKNTSVGGKNILDKCLEEANAK